jgi:hypothetical protein
LTADGNARVRFRRAVEKRSLVLAETAAYEMGVLSLEEALQLVVLYAEAGDDKFERAAVKWLSRLYAEKPLIPFSLAAHAVELVGNLRGPAAGWSATALASLARP